MVHINNSGKNKEIHNKFGDMSLLLASTVGSLGVAVGSVAVLEPGDKISFRRGACLSALGFIFFLSLFDFLNHMALRTRTGSRIRKKYHLTSPDVLEISNKVVSAVQAALSCVTGSIVCMWSCTRSFLHASHFMSEAYAWFGASYFFYDIWSMYRVHASISEHKKDQKSDAGHIVNVRLYLKEQPVIVMHHLFIGSFGFLIIVYLRGGLGDCIFGFVYLMELSTPFVSMRGILSRLKMKSTQLYVTNGLIMIGTFFICRVAMFPYLCYLYSELVGLPYFEAIMALPRGCKISIAILLLPQMYWFVLMVLGAIKVFSLKTNKQQNGNASLNSSCGNNKSIKRLNGKLHS
ncbi:TLC domain-containing protein 3A isoform X1 [Neodiprion fabricii]|uniref:TLC domain-containing protein 3A isoform X1 n=2 Tax=Neodiprion fabricii TaxID=2872261 RepID=UPI001ED9701A|nr:TLC domain-containing protein 3A isoform X1 [Neodiprion fabricii]